MGDYLSSPLGKTTLKPSISRRLYPDYASQFDHLFYVVVGIDVSGGSSTRLRAYIANHFYVTKERCDAFIQMLVHGQTLLMESMQQLSLGRPIHSMDYWGSQMAGPYYPGGQDKFCQGEGTSIAVASNNDDEDEKQQIKRAEDATMHNEDEED
ncbi:hypothetical protein VNO78_22943 [Psophocarpus tetragonolobus]|uniref:Uncharacterized protein n=1 Tax=Psophocarpus tetragonolobus TaxID=3891 RepID=A0AAN9XD38_PSOTE